MNQFNKLINLEQFKYNKNMENHIKEKIKQMEYKLKIYKFQLRNKQIKSVLQCEMYS